MEEKKKSSGLPFAIIVLVLIGAVIGGVVFYNNSKQSAKGNTNTATKKPAVTASAGAQPPNMVGSPTATVTLEEFADFQCPSCSRANTSLQQIKSIYGSRIKFIFRQFPLTQAHPKAYDAAVAAEAAGMQGKFWEMMNQLFNNQQTWVADADHRKIFNDYAKSFGLNVDQFQTDMAGLSAKSRVDADMKRGRELGVASTPTIYVNGMAVPYETVLSVDGMKQVLDAELAKSAPAAQNSNSAPANAAPEQK